MSSAVAALPTGGIAFQPPSPASSPESDALLRMWGEAVIHFLLPATRTVSVEDDLEQLADEWRQGTALMSSVTDIVLHPAYQRIIGKGRSALPFLLHSLEKHPEHWFWALRAITGVDPVAPEDVGRVKKMTEAWVQWGRQQKII